MNDKNREALETAKGKLEKKQQEKRAANFGLPDLDNLPSKEELEEDLQKVKEEVGYRRQWMENIPANMRKLVKVAHAPEERVGESGKIQAQRQIKMALQVEHSMAQAKARWAYALALVTELEAKTFWWILQRLSAGDEEKEIEGLRLLEVREKRPEGGHFLPYNRKFWVMMPIGSAEWAAVKDLVAEFFARLRAMAVDAQEAVAEKMKSMEQEFREGTGKSLVALFGLEGGQAMAGTFVLQIPPQPREGQPPYPGGLLKIQSDGEVLKPMAAMGSFQRFFDQNIKFMVGEPYRLEWVTQEKPEFPYQKSKEKFNALLWLHRAIRRAMESREQGKARYEAAQALKAEAEAAGAISGEEWFLQGLAGITAAVMPKFFIKDQTGRPRTYHHVAVLVERKAVAGRNPKTKIRLLRAVNAEGLFEAECFKGTLEYDPEKMDIQFSGCPRMLGRFLRAAHGYLVVAKTKGQQTPTPAPSVNGNDESDEETPAANGDAQ